MRTSEACQGRKEFGMGCRHTQLMRWSLSRAGTGVLSNGWTSPHPPFHRSHSQRLGKAVRGPNKSTRWPRHHMPDRSRQWRTTPLSGRPPACSFRHHVPPLYVLVMYQAVLVSTDLKCSPGVAGSSPSALTTSLAILVPSSSSSNGPTTTTLTTRGLCPGGWALCVALFY